MQAPHGDFEPNRRWVHGQCHVGSICRQMVTYNKLLSWLAYHRNRTESTTDNSHLCYKKLNRSNSTLLHLHVSSLTAPATEFTAVYHSCPKSLEPMGILFIIYIICSICSPRHYAFSQPLYRDCADSAQHNAIDSSTTVCNSLPNVTTISDFNSTHHP
jgi:hypothetical protein